MKFISRIFGGTVPENLLSENEVHRIVSDIESADVTDQLYEVGRLLIDANRDRTKQLEGKAALIIGYCLAVLAFLVSREPMQSVVVGTWPPWGLRAASVCAAVSLGFAFLALRVRSYAWLSDRQWFENENDVMNKADTLRRCHVLALHAVNSHLRVSNDRKADNVVVAQMFIVGAGLFLATWMALR